MDARSNQYLRTRKDIQVDLVSRLSPDGQTLASASDDQP